MSRTLLTASLLLASMRVSTQVARSGLLANVDARSRVVARFNAGLDLQGHG